MRRPTLYVLMFAVPAALVALVVASAAFAAIAGTLWIFVNGDDPWPIPPRDSGIRLCQCLDASGRVLREADLSSADAVRR